MREHQSAESHLGFFRQRDMIAQLALQIRPANRAAKAELSCTISKIAELTESIRETAQDSCYELLRVSAGLDGILRFLDLESDKSPAHHSLHCLLSPLKQRLDEALGHVHDML